MACEPRAPGHAACVALHSAIGACGPRLSQLQMARITLLPAVLLSLAIGACGSGSGSPTEPADASPFQVEAQSADLVNRARNAETVSPQLATDQLLAEIARAHSEAMRDRGFFSHVDPDGKRLRDRLRAAGVPFRSAGENLAQVQGSADPAGQAHQMLMGSPSHRGNILSKKYRTIGVGVAKAGGTYWITQVFVQP